MSAPSDTLLARLHETQAVSLWNHRTGPIFWYAAAIPGPFYVNTELVIGPDLSRNLLKDITLIVGGDETSAEKAAALKETVITAYRGDPAFQAVVRALIERTQKVFADGSYDLLSGGERRDWLFSIPMAEEMGLRHVYLFKNGQLYCESPIRSGERALHVSDLINNAASYFDNWLPILQKNNLTCIGTVCVNSRGSNGVDKLRANGQKVEALNSIDVSFFEKWKDSSLIDQETLDELRLFFVSARDWASRYVMDRPDLFDPAALDPKSLERMKSFFTKDPWNLRPQHEAFFAEILARL